jgi:hypothetical protein
MFFRHPVSSEGAPPLAPADLVLAPLNRGSVVVET